MVVDRLPVLFRKAINIVSIIIFIVGRVIIRGIAYIVDGMALGAGGYQ